MIVVNGDVTTSFIVAIYIYLQVNRPYRMYVCVTVLEQS